MIHDDPQLVQDFVAEATEHLAVVEQYLLALEDPDATVDPSRIHDVFRAVHSMKGVSAILGMETINRLSHHMENVLNQLRHSDQPPSSAMVEILLRSTDKLNEMVGNIEGSAEVNIETEIEDLARFTERTAQDEPAAGAALEQVEQLIARIEPTIAAVSHAMPANAAATPVAETAHAATVRQPEVPAAAAVRGAQSAADVNVRVPVAILERLMNLAGELVLSRNQLLRVVATRRKTGIEAISSRLDQVTTELQEAIMCSRMQQVGVVFGRFPRLVRDLCKKLNKQCQLTVEGSEVELDKTILEAVADPLTHLMRNSLDHGIELPAKRVANGKPPAGTLVLRAFHQAGKVNITLSDDGAGINRARVLEKAVSKGIITPVQATSMNDREVVALLFAPGFSTAEVVTDVSGRGVGMDVVKTNIEKLGGAVEIDSVEGQGTVVRVSLPLTLAIIPSLVVCDNGVRLALPEASITELVRLTTNDSTLRIERMEGAEVLRLRGALLPLVRLGEVLQNFSPPQGRDAASRLKNRKKLRENERETAARKLLPPPANLIIVESGATKFALAVEQVRDPEQIVVKPLGRHLRGYRFLAGTTVLGDGNIAFILDIVGLAALARLTPPSAAAAPEAVGDADDAAAETQTTLLFRNSRQELFGVPMEMISRIERIHGKQLQQIEDRLVLMYRGSCLPLLALAGDPIVDLRGRDDCYVLVYRIDENEVGLVVPHLVDIRDVSLNVDADLFADSSVMGTVLIDDEIVRLLDLVELVVNSAPATMKATRKKSGGKPAKTVLLAEDSQFIRRQVQRFLEADGYRVVAFEDAQLAWSALESGRLTPDIVVTDIEMPQMNGYDFCRRIRASDRWNRLPVLALTSLSGEEHLRRTGEAGFNDNQLKMDRQSLSNSLRQLLSSQQPEFSPLAN